MCGTQSWLNCDANYQTSAANDQSADSEGGNPIIAVIMFLGTLFGLLFLTALAHCGWIAWRGCRHRHRRHRGLPPHLCQPDTDGRQLTPAGAPALEGKNLPAADKDAADDDGQTSSCSSSSSLTSSDTSLDSTTARIAAQVASRRRSRFLDLTGGGGGGSGAAGESHTPSPPTMPPRRPAAGDLRGGVSGGGGNFLRPPLPRGAFENPAYDYRYDP